MRRIVGRLQERFPNARILVRLDGGFAEPELFTFLDQVCVDYVVGLPKNAVLERLAQLPMLEARMRSLASGAIEHLYTDFSYAARTWDRERRVILKAEVVQLEDLGRGRNGLLVPLQELPRRAKGTSKTPVPMMLREFVLRYAG